MSLDNGINLSWVTISQDGDFAISVDADGVAGLCRDNKGAIYIDGSTPAGELVFGIKGYDASFLPFSIGAVNTDKLLEHGKAVTIMCRATGVGGKTFYLAYAGKVSS